MSHAPHYGARRDEAEPAVVKAFEAGGASVAKVNGKDIPDLIVGFLRETHLVEVKTGNGRRRDGQATFARTWLGSPVVVARTPAQARKWLAVWRDRRGVPATESCAVCDHCADGECELDLDVPDAGCAKFKERLVNALDAIEQEEARKP